MNPSDVEHCILLVFCSSSPPPAKIRV